MEGSVWEVRFGRFGLEGSVWEVQLWGFGLQGLVWEVWLGRFSLGGLILGYETTDLFQILKKARFIFFTVSEVSLPPISPILPLKTWNVTHFIEHY